LQTNGINRATLADKIGLSGLQWGGARARSSTIANRKVLIILPKSTYLIVDFTARDAFFITNFGF
jgi:hypothetical protein